MSAKQTGPVVSIVIPCYNMGQYLDDALGSVRSQTFKDREIIVVDDGSTEQSTLDKLKVVRASATDVTVVSQKNAGLPEARNAGVKVAKGKYIVCLDADDKLEPSYLEKVVMALEKGEKNHVAIATTWLREFGERDHLVKMGGFNVVELLTNNVLHAGSAFTRRAWAEVGGYKRQMMRGYEDWEFWLSLTEKGYKWECIAEPLFRYRVRANSMLTGTRAEHAAVYTQIYDFHKELFSKHAKDLILALSRKNQELHDVISAKNASIDDLFGQVKALRAEADDYKYYVEKFHVRGIARVLSLIGKPIKRLGFGKR